MFGIGKRRRERKEKEAKAQEKKQYDHDHLEENLAGSASKARLKGMANGGCVRVNKRKGIFE